MNTTQSQTIQHNTKQNINMLNKTEPNSTKQQKHIIQTETINDTHTLTTRTMKHKHWICMKTGQNKQTKKYKQKQNSNKNTKYTHKTNILENNNVHNTR